MDEYINHLIVDHKKELKNWMIKGIKMAFSCDEYNLGFQRKSHLESYFVHRGNHDIIQAGNEKKDRQIQPQRKCYSV